MLTNVINKTLIIGATLPDFTNGQSWAQEQGQAILVLAMIGFIIYLGIKREWGGVFGMILVIAFLIYVIKKPDETIISWMAAIVDKLMGNGG